MERRTLPVRLAWQLGTIKALQQETPQVKSITLNLPHWPGHLAGQHVDVRLTAEDGYQVERSYSIASPPQEAPNVTLTIQRITDGEVSSYLVDDLQIGDQLELRGPIGGYFVWDTTMTDPLILIAGGTGIVPLMAMLRYRSLVGSTIATHLVYSARSFEELVYHKELEHLARQTMVQTTYTLTRGAPPPGWNGYTGRITPAILKEILWKPEQHPLIFVCGPTPFVEIVASTLADTGYTPQRIKTERFGPTGDI